jgi:hypothetical protein
MAARTGPALKFEARETTSVVTWHEHENEALLMIPRTSFLTSSTYFSTSVTVPRFVFRRRKKDADLWRVLGGRNEAWTITR